MNILATILLIIAGIIVFLLLPALFAKKGYSIYALQSLRLVL